jgi:hypothetical protein
MSYSLSGRPSVLPFLVPAHLNGERNNHTAANAASVAPSSCLARVTSSARIGVSLDHDGTHQFEGDGPMQSATPTAVAAPVASPGGVVERFQGLPVGEQIAVVGIIVTIFIALGGGVRWWIERRDRITREERVRNEMSFSRSRRTSLFFIARERSRSASVRRVNTGCF